ncbi:MAG: class I SAM-dependent methyltransferase [Mycobacteriales bacterium]
MTVTETQQNDVEALGTRMLESALGAVDILSIYLGDRLGWYRSLVSEGSATPDELAARTGTQPRYAREWLEQQAVTGLLDVDASADPAGRRFSISDALAEVLTDEQSLSYLAPLARMFAAAAGQMPELLRAYRGGGGVGWAAYGADARESQADMNRPWYDRALPGALASVPGLHDSLRRSGCRIGDIGCGAGWSSIALARAYPDATVDGFDIDLASVEMARINAVSAGLADRVRFHHGDAAQLPETTYTAVFAFECIHDMPKPVSVLEAAARSLAPDGCVIVMDEAVAESFVAPGDELERLMYGFSLLICLPDGMAHPQSAGTGTVMRSSTLRQYAADAGLGSFEVLPIEEFGFWRFYRLAPSAA